MNRLRYCKSVTDLLVKSSWGVAGGPAGLAPFRPADARGSRFDGISTTAAGSNESVAQGLARVLAKHVAYLPLTGSPPLDRMMLPRDD